MDNYDIKKGAKNTTEIIVTLPWEKIDKEYQTAFTSLLAEFNYPGFRKGKVPEKIAKREIKKEAIYDTLIRKFIPELYQEVVQKTSLKPIVQPKIELIEAKDNLPWKIKITVAEKPEIILGEYKVLIKQAKTNLKKGEIWVPGKSDKPKETKPEEEKSKLLNEILVGLLKSVKCEISDLIIEDELNRRLAKLVDDIQKIGLTVEKYLASNNLTMEQLKERISKEISDTYKIEFIMSEIADKENIKVEPADLDKIFMNIKDEKEKKEAKEHAYFYASILRKQKTLDYLTSL